MGRRGGARLRAPFDRLRADRGIVEIDRSGAGRLKASAWSIAFPRDGPSFSAPTGGEIVQMKLILVAVSIGLASVALSGCVSEGGAYSGGPVVVHKTGPDRSHYRDRDRRPDYRSDRDRDHRADRDRNDRDRDHRDRGHRMSDRDRGSRHESDRRASRDDHRDCRPGSRDCRERPN